MSRSLVVLVAILVMAPTVAVGQMYFLRGTWEWESTSYTAGGVDTPASVGYSRQIMFGADHTFVAYRNEVPQLTTFWGVSEVYVPPAFIEYVETGEGDTWWHIEFSDDMWYVTLSDGLSLPPWILGPNTKTEVYRRRDTVAIERVNWGDLKAGYR